MHDTLGGETRGGLCSLFVLTIAATKQVSVSISIIADFQKRKSAITLPKTELPRDAAVDDVGPRVNPSWGCLHCAWPPLGSHHSRSALSSAGDRVLLWRC